MGTFSNPRWWAVILAPLIMIPLYMSYVVEWDPAFWRKLATWLVIYVPWRLATQGWVDRYGT